MNDVVKTLLEKSTKANDSGDAMRFAQAAQNAANALACLANAGMYLNK